ncbi:Uncharacterised protein [Klebsiella pneumoniae]|nr:Uncharacterised protein [Klebsiella pneumoniae]
MSLKNTGIRAVADGDKAAHHRQLFGCVTFGVTQTNSGHTHLITDYFIQCAVSVQNDIAVLNLIHQTADKDFFSTEAVTAVDQMHF